jgi:hypothetical protein
MTWTRGESDGEKNGWHLLLMFVFLSFQSETSRAFTLSAHILCSNSGLCLKSKCFKTLCGYPLKRAFLTQLLLLVSSLEWHSQAAKTDLVIQGFIFKWMLTQSYIISDEVENCCRFNAPFSSKEASNLKRIMKEAFWRLC